MHDGGAMAQGAPLDSFKSFVDDFTERTRELKSLLLMRSSEMDPNSQKVMEEMEGAIAKAERSMNSLKCKIASECKSIRRAEELMSLNQTQAERAEGIKKAFSALTQPQCQSVQQGGRNSTGGESTRGVFTKQDANKAPPPPPSSSSSSSSLDAKPGPTAASSSSSSSVPAPEQLAAPPPCIALISEQELQGVPHYVKGRCGLTKLNGVLTALNDVLAVRGELLGKTLPRLSEAQREQVKGWKELAGMHGKGNKPVLREDDLKTAGLKLTESSSKEILGVLKHVQRLKEVRGASGDKAFVCTV